MASILRQIVAGPRARHPEAGLDLCYVTDDIIATSGPSGTYPQVAYRNPLKDLVKWLDDKHGSDWAIWEFRAEGTGYPDSEVYNRIHHYPWPDHHPPPFALIPLIMAGMRNWLIEKDGRVVVVHCKAGKGRSGTIACSYLISEQGWPPEDAMKRFTDRRMRPGFGHGLSIPSQKRTITYVDRWTKHGKKYVEQPVDIVELHIWGLRDGVKVAVEGFEQEGKVIRTFHTFTAAQRQVVRGQIKDTGFSDVAMEMLGKKKNDNDRWNRDIQRPDTTEQVTSEESIDLATGDVVFKTTEPIRIPTCDINIDFERRNRSKMTGFTMVTAVAHVWFNTFFEGNGPEQDGKPDNDGVFEIEWEALDGIKGSAKKGTKAFDKLAVVWRVSPTAAVAAREVQQPAKDDFEKKLGLREATAESAPISRAESLHDDPAHPDADKGLDDLKEVQSGVPSDTEHDEGTKSHIPGHDEADTTIAS
ncbi:hypothetical protein AMS68_006656 [Peltaster fructicola]|uniref:phosphatidylinositol-3,4,5-trisphosphate 3-phosphatase n=1 Tax=Peltaster fructicola TaxID=286661 RepID=A0A6H0Y2R5_9PEZI|nr:hypothetical protein AMS68_006656 [Peltaster fructicola]